MQTIRFAFPGTSFTSLPIKSVKAISFSSVTVSSVVFVVSVVPAVPVSSVEEVSPVEGTPQLVKTAKMVSSKNCFFIFVYPFQY